jgi:type I restriction enzyme M protein
MLNALDPRTWLGSDPERTEARQALRPLAARRAANGRDDPQYWGDFNFDVLMTNPPFSGEIRQKDILERYDFAADALARPNPKEERDVLFLERSLQLLRPGGRMAIVLPQGKLNSPSFESLRGKVMERARILAVVGLHENTFKPHTPTKTSVLFLQKWRPDEEPLADYPIFMAASEFGGKDSRGGYEYLHDAFDQQGNKIINHDLDAIAEAFIEFAQKAGFDWWSEQ